METVVWGNTQAREDLKAFTLNRRNLTPFDVLIKIISCGICHSDIHHKNNAWGDVNFPLVPGHEMGGVVIGVGSNVTQFKINDRVMVGNMVDSCGHCTYCAKSKEEYCANVVSWVYNGRERVFADGSRSLRPESEKTYGGYSGKIVVQEKFVFKLPDKLDIYKSTPLLCAGITMYAPLKDYQMGKGHKVAISGIGGLGHLGIKFAKALGAEVTAITTSEWKVNDMTRLGADNVILMNQKLVDALEGLVKIDMEKPLSVNEQTALSDPNTAMLARKYRDYFDMIISTVPISFDPTPYLRLIKPWEGKLHIVGNMNDFLNLQGLKFVFQGKNITSSNIGGLADTKEMLLFCEKHNIQSDIEMITPTEINTSMVKVQNKQVKYRFVIDLSSLN